MELLAAVVDSSDDAVFAKTLDGTILSWNLAAERLYGYSPAEAIGHPVAMLLPPDREDELERILGRVRAGERVDHYETSRLRRDGTHVDVSVTVSPIRDRDGRIIGASTVARDIGERKRLEQQLQQAKRAEAIGSLAAGVAHDFNNVLMVVRACSALLLKRVHDDVQRREVVQIDEAAQRGAELARQLLAFSKQQAVRPELTDVAVVVHQTLALLERVIGEDVEIELDLEGELPSILVDRGQLGQVIVNLAVNARDAMPEGGRLTFSTRAVGDGIRLCVTDTGVGMDERTRERVFDPFFTTKDAGTGLGLASVHGIVTESGGRIRLTSEPGSGTTFELFFPFAPEARPGAPPAQPETAGVAQGDETILFVEDEETVRVIVAQTLRSYGYTVVEAEDGADAIRLASEREHDIDLLLTDLTMPGMSGRELAARLTEERPGLGIVYTSGYPADTLDVEAGPAYVQKPYDSAELAAAVRRVLDAEQAA